MVDANLNELETPPGETFPKKLPFSGMVGTVKYLRTITKYFTLGSEDIQKDKRFYWWIPYVYEWSWNESNWKGRILSKSNDFTDSKAASWCLEKENRSRKYGSQYSHAGKNISLFKRVEQPSAKNVSTISCCESYNIELCWVSYP